MDKKYLDGKPRVSIQNFSGEKWGEEEITMEEAKRFIIGNQKFSLDANEKKFEIFSNQDFKLKTEKKLEDVSIQKIETFRDNSEVYRVLRKQLTLPFFNHREVSG